MMPTDVQGSTAEDAKPPARGSPAPARRDAKLTGGARTETDQPELVYICSSGHSGSTLLEMLLAGHPKMVAVGELQKMGYRWIGLGGLVSVKTQDIMECLAVLSDILRPDTGLHLFGITRRELLHEAAVLGVVSVDGTSPLKQAFKDDKNNYHTAT